MPTAYYYDLPVINSKLVIFSLNRNYDLKRSTKRSIYILVEEYLGILTHYP